MIADKACIRTRSSARQGMVCKIIMNMSLLAKHACFAIPESYLLAVAFDKLIFRLKRQDIGIKEKKHLVDTDFSFL